MITIDFFVSTREQISSCSWEEACEQFPCAGLSIPEATALTTLSEVLTGHGNFPAKPLPLSVAPFRELADHLSAALREASTDDLLDAGAKWAELQPWKQLDTNSMDLAGFLLHLQSLVRAADKDKLSIFLLLESGGLPLS